MKKNLPLKIFIFLTLLQPSFASAKNSQLWKQWYIYSVAGEPMAYFEETMERRSEEKQLAVTQRWVEKGKSEIYIGAVAKDEKSLDPIAFFSERKSPASSYKIDGRNRNGKMTINIKAIKPKSSDQTKKIEVKDKLILSNFLPLFLSQQSAPKRIVFTAVVEDAQDQNFDPRNGVAQITDTKKNVGGQSCRGSVVEFNGLEGEWWVSKEGKLCELILPTSQAQIRLATEAEAKKSL